MNLQPVFTEKVKKNTVYIPISAVKKVKVKKSKVDEIPDLTKAQILENIRVAVEEMKLIQAGLLKGRPLQELLDEL